jgi:hypothetical protein
MAEFKDVAATVEGDRLRFRCPNCSKEYNWSAAQVMNLPDESIADYCEHCGVGMRVWKPNSRNAPIPSHPASVGRSLQDERAAVVKTQANEPRLSGSKAFEYKVVPFIGQSRGSLSASDVALQLETVIRQQVAEGWEFYQLSDVNIEVQPGCIAGLFGAEVQYVRFNQLIFRSLIHQP